mgnify:CR=1 FL=1
MGRRRLPKPTDAKTTPMPPHPFHRPSSTFPLPPLRLIPPRKLPHRAHSAADGAAHALALLRVLELAELAAVLLHGDSG